MLISCLVHKYLSDSVWFCRYRRQGRHKVACAKLPLFDVAGLNRIFEKLAIFGQRWDIFWSLPSNGLVVLSVLLIIFCVAEALIFGREVGVTPQAGH